MWENITTGTPGVESMNDTCIDCLYWKQGYCRTYKRSTTAFNLCERFVSKYRGVKYDWLSEMPRGTTDWTPRTHLYVMCLV